MQNKLDCLQIKLSTLLLSAQRDVNKVLHIIISNQNVKQTVGVANDRLQQGRTSCKR